MAQDPKLDIPNDLRSFAETGVDRARSAIDNLFGAAHKALGDVERRMDTAHESAREIGRTTIEFAEANIAATFEFAAKLSRATSLEQWNRLHAEFVSEQAGRLSEQVRVLAKTGLGSAGLGAPAPTAKPAAPVKPVAPAKPVVEPAAPAAPAEAIEPASPPAVAPVAPAPEAAAPVPVAAEPAAPEPVAVKAEPATAEPTKPEPPAKAAAGPAAAAKRSPAKPGAARKPAARPAAKPAARPAGPARPSPSGKK